MLRCFKYEQYLSNSINKYPTLLINGHKHPSLLIFMSIFIFFAWEYTRIPTPITKLQIHNRHLMMIFNNFNWFLRFLYINQYELSSFISHYYIFRTEWVHIHRCDRITQKVSRFFTKICIFLFCVSIKHPQLTLWISY